MIRSEAAHMDADGRLASGAGVEYYEQGDYEKAIRELLESAELQEHFKTCARLFDAYSAIGEEAHAGIWIGRAFALNPANAQVACKFSEVLVRRLLRRIDNPNDAEGAEPI